MAYGHELVKDFRIGLPATANTTFTNADAAGWNVTGTVYKARVQEVDISGLEDIGIPDPRVRNYIKSTHAPIRGLPGGNIQFKMFAGAGSADTTTPFETTMLGRVLGTAFAPAAKTDAAEAGSTATVIAATSHGFAVGDGVLIGTRGDSQGNAEVRQISAIDTNDFDVRMALAGAPDATDPIVHGHHAVFNNVLAVEGIDILCILHSGEIINAIGCMGTVQLTGLGIGEIPTLEFDLQVSSWRWDTNSEAIDTASSFSGGNPVPDRSYGGFFWGDAAATTRTLVKCANVGLDFGLAFSPIPNYNGINGKSGQWARTAYEPKLTADFILGDASDDMPGLVSDYENQTQKQVIIQCGYQAQKCLAVAGIGYLTKTPQYTTVDGAEAISVEIGFADTLDPYVYLF